MCHRPNFDFSSFVTVELGYCDLPFWLSVKVLAQYLTSVGAISMSTSPFLGRVEGLGFCPTIGCVLCDQSTIKCPDIYSRQVQSRSADGLRTLRCSMCRRFSCELCLLAILKTAGKSHFAEDSWFKDVKTFLYGSPVATTFVGHCCSLKQVKHQPTEAFQPRRLDGAICFPEYKVLAVSPLAQEGTVDVHVFGKSNQTSVPGAWHATIDSKLAIALEQQNICPSGAGAHLWDMLDGAYLPVTISDIMGRPRTFTLEVFVVEKVNSFQKDRKQGKVTTDDVCDALVFDIGRPSKRNNVVTVILGAIDGKIVHCLCMRFYYLNELQKITGKVASQLRQDVLKELRKQKGRNGYEVRRSGGSSGHPLANKHLFKFLKASAAFPRTRPGVKLVQRKNCWDCFYIQKPRSSSTNRIAKIARYFQPQPGGSFEMTRDIILKYPGLRSFVESKVLAAQILEQLNQYFDIQVQPKAVAKTLLDMEEAMKLGQTAMDRLCLLSADNLWSMVAYPVGYHIDNFKNGLPSLENKVCFVDPRMNGDCGRGGAGASQYVYALLDWTNNTVGRRRRQYLQLGGDPRARVTAPYWNNFVQQRGLDPADFPFNPAEDGTD